MRFFWGFLSLCNGNSFEEGYNRRTDTVDEHSSEIEKRFYERVTDKPDHDVKIVGNLSFDATSDVPADTMVYIQIMRITSKHRAWNIVSGT